MVLGTDVGAFVATRNHPNQWSRIAGVPNAVVNNVRAIPGTNAVVLGTHGRGIWRVNFS